MPRIEHLVFWLGGVIVPHLWKVTRDVLIANGAVDSADLCFALVDLERAVAAGSITLDQFCAQAVGLAKIDLPPVRLVSQIQQTIETTPGILPVIDIVAKHYPLRLLSSFPLEWLSEVTEATALLTYFTDDSVTMTAGLNLDNVYDALLEALAEVKLVTTGRSLLVDDDPIRVEAAIRFGLDATSFVDAARLRRDLFLWGLLPPQVTK
jgi:hypothetical protein